MSRILILLMGRQTLAFAFHLFNTSSRRPERMCARIIAKRLECAVFRRSGRLLRVTRPRLKEPRKIHCKIICCRIQRWWRTPHWHQSGVLHNYGSKFQQKAAAICS
jgi:hypothetical protein